MSETVTEAEVAEDAQVETTPEDDFLKEFEDAEETVKQKPVAEAKTEEPDLKAEFQQLKKDLIAKEINEHLGKLKSSLRDADEMFADLPDQFVDDFLNGEARRTPALEKAFEKSLSDPAAFKGLVGNLSGSMRKVVDGIATRNVAADMKRAGQVARSISTTQPRTEEVNTVGMSDAEFAAHVKTLPYR